MDTASLRDPAGDKSGLIAQTLYVLAAIALGFVILVVAGFALLYASWLLGSGALSLILFGLPLGSIALVFLAGHFKPGLRLYSILIGWLIAGIVYAYVLRGEAGLYPESERNIRLGVTILLTCIVPGSATMITGSRYRATRTQAILFIPAFSLLLLYIWLRYCDFDWFYAIGQSI